MIYPVNKKETWVEIKFKFGKMAKLNAEEKKSVAENLKSKFYINVLKIQPSQVKEHIIIAKKDKDTMMNDKPNSVEESSEKNIPKKNNSNEEKVSRPSVNI